MKRFLTLGLALLMVLSVFVSCSAPASTQGSTKNETTPSQTQTHEAATSTVKKDKWGRDYVESSLPTDLKFDGKTVNICIDKMNSGDWFTEAYTDELINDSVYDRNIKVETDLDVKLNFIVSDAALNSTKFVTEVETIVNSGTNDYDIVSGWGYFLTSGVRSLVYANLYDIPYLDLEKPWWNQSYVKEATLADQLYTVTGDLSLSTTYNAGVIFFNKRLANEEYASLGGADYIYQLVLDGKWTIDKFTELVKEKYRDMDGDGLPSEGDFYGFGTIMSGPIPADAFQFGMNAPITERNAEGIPEFVFDSEKTVSVLHKLYVLTQDCEGVLFDTKYYNNADARSMMQQKFIGGSMIFLPGSLQLASSFLDMKDDYGLLPMPKYDEAQAQYKTSQSDAYYAMAIPFGIDVSDRAELAGATLEKLCEESYRSVTPNYFEVAMKYRYLRSEDDSDYDLKMYDIILAGNGFNFGLIFSSALENPSFAYRHLIGRDGSENFASYWGGKSTYVEGQFNNLINWFIEE